MARCQEWMALALGFWTVPLTVALFAWRYLTRQDPHETVIHAALIWFSIMLAAGFQITMVRMLRAVPLQPEAADDAKPTRPAARIGDVGSAALAVTVLLAAATYAWANTDQGLSLFAPDLPKAAPTSPATTGAAETPGPSATTVADDEDAWGSDSLNFAGRSLVGAHGNGAYLRRANLKNANLSLADLSGAMLRSADLSGAKLRCTDLSGADLRGVVGLTAEALAEACGSMRQTKLPPGLGPLRACAEDCKPQLGWFSRPSEPPTSAAPAK